MVIIFQLKRNFSPGICDIQPSNPILLILGGEYYKSSKNILLILILLPWNFNLKDMKPRIYYITHWRSNKNQATRGTIHFIMGGVFYETCSSTFWANSYLFNIIILFCAHVYMICKKIIILPGSNTCGIMVSFLYLFYFSLFFSVFVCVLCIFHRVLECLLRCVWVACVFFP